MAVKQTTNIIIGDSPMLVMVATPTTINTETQTDA